MNEEQKQRFNIFIIDFENSIKDISGYLSTKENVTSIVLTTFIKELQRIIDEMKQDIDFLSKELIFDIGKDEKAYITNFIIAVEDDTKSILNYIQEQKYIDFKTYNVYFNDFISKIRNLKHNVKFLQNNNTYEIVVDKIIKNDNV